VPLADLKECAEQLKGAPLMKDHDIDHVDSIIGKVEDAWVEEDAEGGGKVLWKGETVDESLIQKILLGYVKNDSIQIAVPFAYCDNCVSKLGVKEEEAALDNLDFPCPRCGSLEMIARHPQVLEQSIVAIPAYQKAEFTPFGFKAAFDDMNEKRIENAKKAGWKLEEGKTVKPKVTMPDLSPLVVKAFSAVAGVQMAVIETEARLLQSSLEEALPSDSGYRGPEAHAHEKGVGHVAERMGGPEEWMPEVDDKGEEIHRQSRVPTGAEHAHDRFQQLGQGGVPEAEIKDFPLAERPGKGEAGSVEQCPKCRSDFVIQSDDGSFECGGCGHQWAPFGKTEGLDPEYGWCKRHNKPWETHNQMDLAQDEEANEY